MLLVSPYARTGCRTYQVMQCMLVDQVETDGTKGLLLLIDMAALTWTDIALDFLTKLPTVLSKSTVIVVVDRFSKMLKLIPLGEQTDNESVARAFFDYVVCIHGLPWTITSDRDPRFVG